MATLDPLQEDLVHEVDTQNVPAGLAVDCQLQWKSNYPASFQQKITAQGCHVDLRLVHASRYEVSGQTSGNNTTDIDHPMSWDKSALANTNEMEIFAVIRAEYRFIDDGWTKKMSKKASQGIDSLFYLNNGAEYWAIVESKCTTDVAAYNKYCGGGSPLGRLGKANPKIKGKKKAKKDLSPGGVTQMTDPWVYHAFLQEAAGNSNPQVISNLEDLWGFLGGGDEVHKWMNVYGTETFHMVPGVYKSLAVIQGLGAAQPMEDIEIKWPDDCYRDEEFFTLTETTNDDCTSYGIVSGTWHDISDKFEKLSDKEMSKINQKDLDTMIDDVEMKFG